MKNTAFVTKALDIVSNYKTVYMYGTFGMPVSESLIQQKLKQYGSGYYNSSNMPAMRALIGKGFGFDCVGLIKGILWGWSGDLSKSNGGAGYTVNGVPDTSANGMIQLCKDVSGVFGNIMPGEVVWLAGHIGIYIGNGKVIESTPSWSNGVQITACKNLGTVTGLYSRAWTSHGKLPWVEYVETDNGTGGENVVKPDDGDVDVEMVVDFSGGHVYGSSDAKTPASKTERSAGLVEITATADGKPNPYHVKSVDGGGVFGWVKASAIKIPTYVGRMGYITGTHYATGQKIPEYVRTDPHVISAVDGDRFLLGHPTGINSYVYKKDFSLA